MGRAVVIGGGPTGLATAMLLAKQGVEVVVVDRDPAAPDSAAAAWDSWERRSVSQFRQVHYFQARGRELLAERLPEVLDEMDTAGIPTFNLFERMAEALPDGPGDVDFSPLETRTTCRRPLLEYAFVAAARRTPGVELRHDTAVAGLLTGPSVLDGVPNVTGVVTGSGEELVADVVVDVSGRRSAVPGMLEAVGAVRPTERVEDLGFVYNTRYYRGPVPPEYRGDGLAAVGSFSLLTMPGDDDYWSVTIYHSPKDKAMRNVRDPEIFDRVVRACPLHAHWVDGTPDSDQVVSMASSANTTRSYVVDGRPCATGVVPVGDAWGFTNPSLGRGIALGLVHAVPVADAVAATLDRPAGLVAAWDRVTTEHALPWHEATVAVDRMRGPEVEAFRQGLPDPHDPTDMGVAASRAFLSATHYDAQVLRWLGEMANCRTLPEVLTAQPEVAARVIDVVTHNPTYETPGPSRAELEELLV